MYLADVKNVRTVAIVRVQSEEWEEFCSWIEGLPYAKLITYEGEKNGEK